MVNSNGIYVCYLFLFFTDEITRKGKGNRATDFNHCFMMKIRYVITVVY